MAAFTIALCVVFQPGFEKPAAAASINLSGCGPENLFQDGCFGTGVGNGAPTLGGWAVVNPFGTGLDDCRSLVTVVAGTNGSDNHAQVLGVDATGSPSDCATFQQLPSLHSNHQYLLQYAGSVGGGFVNGILIADSDVVVTPPPSVNGVTSVFLGDICEAVDPPCQGFDFFYPVYFDFEVLAGNGHDGTFEATLTDVRFAGAPPPPPISTPVPEPASLGLVAIGLAALARGRRNRTQNS